MIPRSGQNGFRRLVRRTTLPPARTSTLSASGRTSELSVFGRGATRGIGYTVAMPATTRTFGFILIVLGLASYFLTGRVSVTALIPAFFGAIFVILALVARSEPARKHAMHAAVALGLLGFLGTLRVIPAVARGEFTRPAVLAQLAMMVLMGIYVALGVKSFKAARRARLAR